MHHRRRQIVTALWTSMATFGRPAGEVKPTHKTLQIRHATAAVADAPAARVPVGRVPVHASGVAASLDGAWARGEASLFHPLVEPLGRGACAHSRGRGRPRLDNA